MAAFVVLAVLGGALGTQHGNYIARRDYKPPPPDPQALARQEEERLFAPMKADMLALKAEVAERLSPDAWRRSRPSDDYIRSLSARIDTISRRVLVARGITTPSLVGQEDPSYGAYCDQPQTPCTHAASMRRSKIPADERVVFASLLSILDTETLRYSKRSSCRVLYWYPWSRNLSAYLDILEKRVGLIAGNNCY